MSDGPSTRQCYVISYDISDPRRLRRVFKVMLGYGDHLQLSVFRCELNARELVELKARLTEVMNLNEDQVLFVDVGPAGGRALEAFESLGRTYSPSECVAVIV